MSGEVTRRSILQVAVAPALLSRTQVSNIPLQDTTKENGYMESLDRHVTPHSLYLTQLRERIGDQAVRNVALPSQVG